MGQQRVPPSLQETHMNKQTAAGLWLAAAGLCLLGSSGAPAQQRATEAQFRDYLTNHECYWPDFQRDPAFKLCPPSDMHRRTLDTGGWRAYRNAAGPRGYGQWPRTGGFARGWDELTSGDSDGWTDRGSDDDWDEWTASDERGDRDGWTASDWRNWWEDRGFDGAYLAADYGAFAPDWVYTVTYKDAEGVAQPGQSIGIAVAPNPLASEQVYDLQLDLRVHYGGPSSLHQLESASREQIESILAAAYEAFGVSGGNVGFACEGEDWDGVNTPEVLFHGGAASGSRDTLDGPRLVVLEPMFEISLFGDLRCAKRRP